MDEYLAQVHGKPVNLTRLLGVLLDTTPGATQGYISRYDQKKKQFHPLTTDPQDGKTTFTVHEIRIGEEIVGAFHVDVASPLPSPAVMGLLQLTLQVIHSEAILQQFYGDKQFFSKDLFLANLSHEVRSPLNGVVGYAQLLMETQLSPTQQQYVKNMNQCSVQLMRIINDILDFSKLASNNMKLTHDCFALREVVQSVNQIVDGEMIPRRQKLRWAGQNIVEFLVADRQKLVQVLVNLVTNASKFSSPKSHILVTFRQNVHQPDGSLYVSVADQGIGIAQNEQCRLFNSFVQIQKSLTKPGTGLGLAIAKRLAELLGGTIGVKSVLGQGSTFWFTFAFEPAVSLEEKCDIKRLKGKRVLVVDDIQENRIMLTDLLFEWEMRPMVCASALEAFRMITSNRYQFDVALLDICMPGTSGVELAQQIKEDRPLFPLIALSSADSSLTAGLTVFEHVLMKPVNRGQLCNALIAVLWENGYENMHLQDSPRSESSRSGSPSSPGPVLSSLCSRAKLLIADDLDYNREMLTAMVQQLGFYQVVAVSDGREALRELQRGGYDVLFLDLRMPHMDGFALLAALAGKTILENLTVIVQTASIISEDRERCKLMGVDYFLTKPLQLAAVRQVLHRALQVKYK